MGANKYPFYVYIDSIHPEVTGSCITVNVNYPDKKKTSFFVDCGLFQENQYDSLNEGLSFEPSKFSFGLITHNHVDHIGRVPLLVKEGFRGRIYTSVVTKKLMPLALNDTVAIFKGERSRNQRRFLLYNDQDIVNTMRQTCGCRYKDLIKIDKHIEVTFYRNAHLIGAAMIHVKIKYPGYKDINLLFTGDYNDHNMFLNTEELPDEVKKEPINVVIESTYGYMDSSSIKPCFEENIHKKLKEKGTIVIPVFSLGRAQEVLYILKRMQEQKKIGNDIPIYFDGRLTRAYTSKYLHEDLDLKEEMRDFLPDNLVYVSRTKRMEIINSKRSKIIVSSSGMGSYGPVQTYISSLVKQPNVLIHFTGYSSVGSLGRKLQEANDGSIVEVGGRMLCKRAEVKTTNEFSSHAKADQLIKFLQKFENLRLVLVNHGEKDSKVQFAKRVEETVEAKDVGILGAGYGFKINSYGLVTTKPSKFM